MPSEVKRDRVDDPPLVILIVDHSLGDRLLVRQLLARTALAHAIVQEAASGDHALAAIRQSPPDCVLLDQNGLASLAALRAFSDVPVVLIAEVGAETRALEALQHGAQDYLVDDELTPGRLQRSIQRAIATVRVARERDQARALLTTTRDALQASEQRLAMVLAASQLVMWEWDVADGTLTYTAAEALRASQQNLAALIDNIDGKIWSVDDQYRLIVGNALFQQSVTNVINQEVLPGTCLVTLPLPQEALERWRGWYDRALAGERFSIEESLQFAPEPRIIEYRFSPIRDAAGAITGVTVFGRDITARLHARQTLRDTERKLGTLFELLPVGVSIFDAAGTLVYVNPALEQILRMDRAGLLQEAHLARPYFRPDGTLRPLDELVRYRVLREHQALTNQMNGFLTETGEEVWTNVNGVLVDFPDWRAVLITTDITQRKHAEDALRASETRYRTLFETMGLGVAYHDTAGRVSTTNPAAEHILGLRPDQLHGYSVLDDGWSPICEDGTPFPKEEFPTLVALRTGEQVRDVVLGLRHPGLATVRWLSLQAIPVALPGETDPSHAYTIFEDITERRTAQRALEYERQQLDAIIRTLYEGLIAFHPDGAIAVINEVALRLFDLEPGPELETLAALSHAMDFIALDTAGQPLPPATYPFARILRGERFADLELRLWHPAWGSERWLVFSGTPVYDPRGQLVLGVVTAHAITERKRADLALAAHAENLSRTNAELTRALRLRDEFLAMMSHELRSPLSAVLGITEALDEELYGPISARQRTALDRITQSGRHLLAILSDILDLAHIEAGKVVLDVRAVDVDILCHTALQFVQTTAQQKNLRVLCTIALGIEGLRADERRLTQILINLLDNAVKFTPVGGTVGMEVTSDAGLERITFVVWDTGIGIAEADCERLFQPFTQVDGRLSRQYNGIGLGLTLVHRLVDLHDGSITLTSTPGQGSRFTVSLPWSAADNEAQPATPTQKALVQRWVYPPRIVLADDHEITLQFYAELLRQHGCQVALARTGAEALAQVRATRPDLAVLDIQMPELDGLTAIRLMRAEPSLASMVIIALTALAMPGDRERCLAAGATRYLAKPVNLRTLIATITEVLAGSSTEGPGA